MALPSWTVTVTSGSGITLSVMVVPEIDLPCPNNRAAAGVAAGWLSWAWTSPGYGE